MLDRVTDAPSTTPQAISSNTLATPQPRYESRDRASTRLGSGSIPLLWRPGFLKTPVVQHRLRVGRRTAPRVVHLAEVFRVAAGQDHLAEAVAVSACQAPVFDEPLKGIVGEHFCPEVSVVAGAILASPDVGEVGRAIARRDVADVQVSLIECLLLELIGLLQRGAGRKRMPLNVE